MRWAENLKNCSRSFWGSSWIIQWTSYWDFSLWIPSCPHFLLDFLRFVFFSVVALLVHLWPPFNFPCNCRFDNEIDHQNCRNEEQIKNFFCYIINPWVRLRGFEQNNHENNLNHKGLSMAKQNLLRMKLNLLRWTFSSWTRVVWGLKHH